MPAYAEDVSGFSSNFSPLFGIGILPFFFRKLQLYFLALTSPQLSPTQLVDEDGLCMM